MTWGARYDAYDEPFDLIEQIEPSPASESLLRSLIDIDDDEALIYSRPAAWADIVIIKEVNTDNNIDIVIDNLRLELTYDFIRNTSYEKVRLNVLAPGDGIMQYIIVDPIDCNERQDGRGGFYRTYDRDESVTLMAPQSYGIWEFKR